MAVRRPLIYNANDGMIEMTGSQLSTVALRVLDLYVANNPVVLTAVGGGGNLGTINDTRKTASAMVTNISSFQNPAALGTNTIGFSKIQQTVATVSAPSGDKPVYWNDTTGITEMTNADFADTFLAYPFGLLTSGTVGNNSAGTYFISTANSVSGATKIGDVFIDTRANAGAYTSAGITETQDQPTTITTYRLHRRDTFGTVSAYVTPFKIHGTILIEQMRFHATNTPGFRITYNIDGTGTASGSAILNTTKNSNSIGQLQVNADDYRAQRFPSGGNTTANSYQFKIRLN